MNGIFTTLTYDDIVDEGLGNNTHSETQLPNDDEFEDTKLPATPKPTTSTPQRQSVATSSARRSPRFINDESTMPLDESTEPLEGGRLQVNSGADLQREERTPTKTIVENSSRRSSAQRGERTPRRSPRFINDESTKLLEDGSLQVGSITNLQAHLLQQGETTPTKTCDLLPQCEPFQPPPQR
jgi:hypothetical protein